MKKFLLLTVFVASYIGNAYSQCSNLIISEYVEGWNNNKALELYNPTNASIDLSGYRISRYSNGSQTPSSVDLSGTIEAYSAYVLVIDKQDTTQTGQDTSVWAELALMADAFLCPDYNVSSAMYFNGNDAVTLETTTGSIVDIFGKVGEDPGSSWTDVYPYTDAAGNYWTKDQTLIRKTTVKTGVTTNPSYFDPTAEWDSLPANTFYALGCHKCECDPNYASVVCDGTSSAINEIGFNDNIFFFPNPSLLNKTVNVKGTSIIQYAEIYNTMGEIVYSKRNESKRGEMVLQLSDLTPSVYFVRVVFDNKHSVVKDIIVK